MKLILSTLSSPNKVVFTKDLPSGAKQIVKEIIIKGGANVVDKKTTITPAGVITELTDEDWELLKACEWYKRQNAAGFVRPVESHSDADDPAKKGMNKRDKSAQKTDGDFVKVKPKTGKVSDVE